MMVILIWNSQRNPTSDQTNRNRQNTGATYRPFQPQNLPQRHTEQINPTTISAEEFPWASTQQGGSEGFVFPATKAEQGGMVAFHSYP